MFTGLIREIGRIKAMVPANGVTRLVVEAPRTAAAASAGDSIAVNGICLTVVRTSGRTFTVEAAAETLRLTTLSGWRRGRRVHLEPALRAGDPIDGHLVQGHVDGQGSVDQIRKSGGSLFLTVALPSELARFLTPKGSVAVDGVSLTVDEGPFAAGRFTVNLIPHTLAWTTFDQARTGQKVNLEMDVLVKAARGAAGWSDIPTLDKNIKEPAGRPGLTIEQLLAKGYSRTGRTRKGSS